MALDPDPKFSWRLWVWPAAVVAAIFGAIFTFFALDFSVRERECQKRCTAAGYQRYEYMPPKAGTGFRFGGGTPDKCSCF
jgi:hypothetical protein